MVLNQAAGGLLVALIIKHADNMIKAIATALAIIASGVVSQLLLESMTAPSAMLITGGVLVVSAAVAYSVVE
jgi:UDP-sugar transporter A1/2/3